MEEFVMKKTKRLIALAMSAVMSCTALTATVNAAWVNSDKGTMWQNSDGTYAKSKWITMKSGNKYYIKSNGTRATGLLSIKNDQGGKDYYYFNDKGIMQTGWQNVNDAIYYFTADGAAATTTQIIGNYAYKFSAEGIWDGKVYSKDGKKDVTSTVDIKELVPVALVGREAEYGKVKKITGAKPATVTINGLKYRTDADNSIAGPKKIYVFPEGNYYTKSYINIANCTDADLDCLKYMSDIEILTLGTYTNEEMKDSDTLSIIVSNNVKLITNITNLDFCYYMPNLKYVTIYNAPYLSDVSGLSVCKNLKEVKIYNCGVKSLDGMEKLTKIDTFYAFNTRLENLNGLRNCNNLRSIIVNRAYLTDISGLTNKSKLIRVELTTNRRLLDITPLATCDNLKTVSMSDCNGIMDWSTLLNIATLERVAIYRSSKKSNAQVVHDTLKSRDISYGIYDSLIYNNPKSPTAVLPHNSLTIDCNEYWDNEKFTADVYEVNYPCKCSYCENWRKTGKNWTINTQTAQAIIDLGTYKE